MRILRTHIMNDLSTSEMYNHTQCQDVVNDGDIFVCNGGRTVGFLMKAWPTLLAGELGSLEKATPEGMRNFRQEYPDTFRAFDAMGVDLDLADGV
jgi:hypothetical protein